MDTYDARPPLSAKSPRSAEKATGGLRRRLTVKARPAVTDLLVPARRGFAGRRGDEGKGTIRFSCSRLGKVTKQTVGVSGTINPMPSIAPARPVRSSRSDRSRATICVAFATESFGRPVIAALNSTFPGASAQSRLLVSGTQTAVASRLRFSASPWTTTTLPLPPRCGGNVLSGRSTPRLYGVESGDRARWRGRRRRSGQTRRVTFQPWFFPCQ